MTNTMNTADTEWAGPPCGLGGPPAGRSCVGMKMKKYGRELQI